MTDQSGGLDRLLQLVSLAFWGIMAVQMSVQCDTALACDGPGTFAVWYLLLALFAGRLLRSCFGPADEESFD
jgi:hypothetical protein